MWGEYSTPHRFRVKEQGIREGYPLSKGTRTIQPLKLGVIQKRTAFTRLTLMTAHKASLVAWPP